jgi:hypothetical protein
MPFNAARLLLLYTFYYAFVIDLHTKILVKTQNLFVDYPNYMS